MKLANNLNWKTLTQLEKWIGQTNGQRACARLSDKNDTDNSEVHHQDSEQQGLEKKGVDNQTGAIYNLVIGPHDHA